MRRNSAALAAALLLLAGCGGDAYRKIKVDLPAYSPLKLEQYREVAVTNFLITKEFAGLDLNKELGAYFKQEFEKKFRGKVSSLPVSPDSQDVFQKPDFWKSQASSRSGLLLVTGAAQLSRETRKAVFDKDTDPREAARSPQRGISERAIFTLDISLYLIAAETGEILMKKEYKETKTYATPKQRADFAFYDLAQRVRQKLFRPILTEEQTQDRYLLAK
jgi:hypothetical protein